MNPNHVSYFHLNGNFDLYTGLYKITNFYLNSVCFVFNVSFCIMYVGLLCIVCSITVV